MKKLYLLRHAKAEPGGKEVSDPERVLSTRGHEASAVMGEYMKAKRYLPDIVLSSSSARTRETLERVTQASGMAPKVRFLHTLYLASAGEILEEVQAAEDDSSSMMVVGHNPGMHHIALSMCEPERTKLRAELELKFPTCALAVLHFGTGSWREIAPLTGKLHDFIVPGEL